MSPRSKLFLASVAACAAALVLVCFAQYRRGLRAVDDALRADAEARARRFARAVEAERDARLDDLHDLVNEPAVLQFYSSGGQLTSERTRNIPREGAPPDSAPSSKAFVPGDLLARARDFYERSKGECSAIMFVTGEDDSVIVRVEPPRDKEGNLSVKTGDMMLGAKGIKSLRADTVVAGTSHPDMRRAKTVQGALVYLVPIVGIDVKFGTLVAEFKPDSLAGRAAGDQGGAGAADATGSSASRAAFQPVVIAREGGIVYHANDALKFQPVERVLPYFNNVATEMAAGREGSRDYVDADGARWIAAYAPVRDLDLSVAVAANESASTAALRRQGMLYVALSSLLALIVVSLVAVRERRAARRIESIARAARAVADGDLDRRLEVSESDRARPIADSFNLMTERLREHIRRESEGRQFHAFMRLSATLTHDLKNAITGLSMLVANMERRWEREEFRADAAASLRDSVDKLNRIVARLSKPVETLSGEYRAALRPVDLSRVVRRVVEATAGQSPFHEVEMSLSEGLEVIADVERLERVFENLVINALEAMGASKGRLTVEGGREGDQSVFVTVADTGAGMTPEFIRSKLFQPFATTKKQGLGLGLYTCREVVEAHGGRIDVESRPSSGTRFRVVLPSRPDSLPRDDKT